MPNVYAIIILVAVLVFFGIVLFSGRKLKEYAIWNIDGEVLHLWRKQQDWWFDWSGGMAFYERDGSRVIIEKHYVKRFKELKTGEWEKIEESLLKDK